MTVQLTPPNGLTDSQAARQLAEQGSNTIASPRPPSAAFRVLAQLGTR